MGLKEIKASYRIVFLRAFVEKLIVNSIRDERIKQKIKEEKLKQKFLSPPEPPEKVFERVIKSKVFQIPKGFQKSITETHKGREMMRKLLSHLIPRPQRQAPKSPIPISPYQKNIVIKIMYIF